VPLGQQLADAIPGATLDVIADARHFLPEEAPRQVADSLTALLER
jgi:pimeloyl-ACP methyl ester carboxylesterase